jgi:hypothetical protein
MISYAVKLAQVVPLLSATFPRELLKTECFVHGRFNHRGETDVERPSKPAAQHTRNTLDGFIDTRETYEKRSRFVD